MGDNSVGVFVNLAINTHTHHHLFSILKKNTTQYGELDSSPTAKWESMCSTKLPKEFSILKGYFISFHVYIAFLPVKRLAVALHS